MRSRSSAPRQTAGGRRGLDCGRGLGEDAAAPLRLPQRSECNTSATPCAAAFDSAGDRRRWRAAAQLEAPGCAGSGAPNARPGARMLRWRRRGAARRQRREQPRRTRTAQHSANSPSAAPAPKQGQVNKARWSRCRGAAVVPAPVGVRARRQSCRRGGSGSRQASGTLSALNCGEAKARRVGRAAGDGTGRCACALLACSAGRLAV